MATGMNVVNLSIGGPDYLDQPFVEKVSVPWSCTLHAWRTLLLRLDQSMSGICAKLTGSHMLGIVLMITCCSMISMQQSSLLIDPVIFLAVMQAALVFVSTCIEPC